MSRRASGSLSPRLIEFKRRESIDSFENHEKHHEHETNELQNLSSQISKSLSSKVEEVIGLFISTTLSAFILNT